MDDRHPVEDLVSIDSENLQTHDIYEGLKAVYDDWRARGYVHEDAVAAALEAADRWAKSLGVRLGP